MSYHAHPTPTQIYCGLCAAGVSLTFDQWIAAIRHAENLRTEAKGEQDAAIAAAEAQSAAFARKLGGEAA